LSGRLSQEQRDEITRIMSAWPLVVRVFFVPGEPVARLAFEYAEGADDAGAAAGMMSEVVAAVVPVLGDAAGELAITVGGPAEIEFLAAGGEVIYERT
jgi:hypothetical protein